MYYSFEPLATCNTINDHTGFVVLCAFAVCVLLLTIPNMDFASGLMSFLGVMVVVGIGAYVSWTTGSITTHENIKVTGRLVDFVSESERKSTGGKNPSTTEHHYSFAVYEVEGTRIMMPYTPKTAMPNERILYRNKEKESCPCNC